MERIRGKKWECKERRKSTKKEEKDIKVSGVTIQISSMYDYKLGLV